MEIIRVRSFTKNDYKKIFEYNKEHIIHNFPDSIHRDNLLKTAIDKDLHNPRAYFFFAMDEETKKPIAFLWLRIEKDPYKEPRPYRYLDLHYIHVDECWRKKGIGEGLMEFTMKFAKKKKCREIRLGTHTANNAAQNLYKKFSFEPYRVIMRTFV